MGTFQKLHPAFIDDIPILVESETKIGGKKTVTHEYVNSNKRFTEELGKIPPKFTINAIVHGEDAIQRRKNLESKLDSNGIILLKHPVFGDVFVKSTTYTSSSNQASIGEFKFVINFETSEALAPEFKSIETKEKAIEDANEARKALDDYMFNQWKPPQKPSNLKKIANKADSVFAQVSDEVLKPVKTIQDVSADLVKKGNVFTDAVDDASKLITQTQKKVSDFKRTVNNTRSKIFAIIQKPAQLKAALKDLYTIGLNIVDTPADLFDVWKNLIDFGFIKNKISIGASGTTGISTNSSEVNTDLRIEEDIDKNLLDEHTRMTSFVNLMEASTFKDFDTSEDIQQVREFLDNTFTNLINNQIVLTENQLSVYTPMAKDPQVRTSIQNLRNTVNSVLNQKIQTIWRVADVNTAQSSMVLTSYRFYGDLENVDKLRVLNPGVNSSNYNETIKALTK